MRRVLPFVVLVVALGNATGAAAADLAGPVIGQRSAAVLLRGTLHVSALDPSGIAQLTVDVPGHGRLTAPPGSRRLAVRAPAGRGWVRGPRAVFVTAVDGLGNTTTRRIAFDAVESFGLPCGRGAAIDLITNTPRIQEALGLDAAALHRALRISQTRCVDLDGDGTRELVALLRPRSGRPTPLVVARVSAAGAYRPVVVSVRHRVRRLATGRRVVVGHIRGGTVRVLAGASGRPVLRVRRG